MRHSRCATAWAARASTAVTRGLLSVQEACRTHTAHARLNSREDASHHASFQGRAHRLASLWMAWCDHFLPQCGALCVVPRPRCVLHEARRLRGFVSRHARALARRAFVRWARGGDLACAVAGGFSCRLFSSDRCYVGLTRSRGSFVACSECWWLCSSRDLLKGVPRWAS